MDTGLLLKTRFDVVADGEDKEDKEDKEDEEEEEDDEYGITFLAEVVKVPASSFRIISCTIRSRAAVTGGLRFGNFFFDQSRLRHLKLWGE